MSYSPDDLLRSVNRELENLEFVPIAHAQAEDFLEVLKEQIEEVEADLRDDQRITFVHGQTGEPIFVTLIAHKGPAIVLSGYDQLGQPTTVFASVSSMQLAFKVVSVETPEPRKPIGFSLG